MKKWLPYVATAAALYTFMPHVRARYCATHITRHTTDAGILMTFDDGVHPIYTPQLLDVLAQYDVRAIFFVVGERAAQHPHIVKMIHDRGHVLGIHHYTHTSTFSLSKQGLYEQITRTQALLQHIIGERVTLYRPPFGHLSRQAFQLQHVHTMLWTGIFGDWKRQQPEKLVRALHEQSKQGAIFVLHDSGENKGAHEDAPAYMIAALSQFFASTSYTFTDAKRWAAAHVDRA